MEMCKTLAVITIWISLQRLGKIHGLSGHFERIDVDTFVNSYINEVKRTLRLTSEEHVINKRSQPEVDIYQLKGLELLVGFQEVFSLPARFPNDLVLFSKCKLGQQQTFDPLLYAAALEANLTHPLESQANGLVLYKYNDGAWMEVDRVVVAGGVQLATEQIGDFVYIIVAEYLTEKSTTVYSVNTVTHKLQFVHSLPIHFPSHVIMWKWEDMDAFAVIAVSENPPGSENRYSTQSPVYRWLGSHFDEIDSLPTYNPRAVTQFNIRNSMFIAVANFQNDFGDLLVHSDIFRFNVALGKFTLYQKLPTEAAIDIKYFCFKGPKITESFLVYASAFHKDEEGNEDFYSATSVVYKLSDEDYFLPFQALSVPKVTGWVPVRHNKGDQESLTLIAVSEKGISSFQYDGWKFVPTGVFYDRFTFGPGEKSIRVFYHGHQTLISTANKQSSGNEMNVFSPVFKHHSQLEDLQLEMRAWDERMSQELAKGKENMVTLLQTVRAAPSINDPIIQLGSEVVFQNAEIDHVVTFKTKVGEHDTDAVVWEKLQTLNLQLDALKEQLGGLKKRIDDTSVHTRNIFGDVFEPTADIKCTHACRVEKLEVSYINTVILSEFLSNTVNINELVEFEDNLTFDHMALRDPLNATLINGHSFETLIDWSKHVILNHGLEVRGEVKLENDLVVLGTVDGVNIGVEKEGYDGDASIPELSVQFLNSLNTSHLFLADGTLSEVDFVKFKDDTLKTQGDQLITESQDFDKIEADEVIAMRGLYRTGPSLTPSTGDSHDLPCEGQSCTEEVLSLTSQSRSTAKPPNSYIESINFVDGEITIPNDFTIDGTVLIENGMLYVEDLIDSKHIISANYLMEMGVPLNQPVMDEHFEFRDPFQSQSLDTDTVNGVDLASLVNASDLKPQVVTARKEFRGGLDVMGTFQVTDDVNGVHLTQLTDPVVKSEKVHIENLTVQRVNSSIVQVGGFGWHQLETRREGGRVYLKHLQVKKDLTVNNVTVRGHINDVYLEELLQDTVYKNENSYLVTGKKHFVSHLNISNMFLSRLNSVNVDNLTPEVVWKNRLEFAKWVEVDNLSFTGQLDGVTSSAFGEWLMTEGDQTMLGSQTLDSLEAENVQVAQGATFNSLDIHHIATEAVFLTDNITLDNVFLEESSCSEVSVGGRLGGLVLPEDIVLSDTGETQQMSAHKHFHGSVTIDGHLHSARFLSSVDLTNICQALVKNSTKLVITGDSTFKEEPIIMSSVNTQKWTDLMDRVWLKEANVNITAPMLIYSAQFDNVAVESINNDIVEERLSNLISLTKNESINGTFYFPGIVMQKGLEVREASVGGNVQGIELPSFFETVMLDGVDQEVRGYADFSSLTVDGVLEIEGSVNGWNLSQDIMLSNAANNTMTSTLTVTDLLSVEELRLPKGALIAGVDLHAWNSTVVKVSTNGVFNGNLLVKTQFDAGNGMRVEGLVNGLHFDKDHVMTKSSSQVVTGTKKFSSDAKLDISNLRVKGFLNGINITDFYNQQVTLTGNYTFSGRKSFESPLNAYSVELPEMYQGFNLTWLQTQMVSVLPRTQYLNQLTNMNEKWLVADSSLRGRVHNLKKLTRRGDLEGIVLFSFPLKAGNSSVLASIRQDINKTTLSLLHWNDSYQTFVDIPGSLRNVLKTAPTSVQSVTMPGGEVAAYITSYLPLSTVGHGEIFRLKDKRLDRIKVYGGEPGSHLISFQDYDKRTCFIVVTNTCLVYCRTDSGRRFRMPSFSCQNLTEASTMRLGNSVYLVGLQHGLESVLVVWRFSEKRFTPVLFEPQFNPVSLAVTAAKGPYFAVANRHRTGSAHPESINIYRFKEETFELILEQNLHTISPKKVLLAELSWGESGMYVVSDNPASPLQLFLHRGILGYQLSAVEATLPRPLDVHLLTDSQQRHFVIVSSKQQVSILQAQFEGLV